MIRWLLWLLAGALLGGIVHLVAVLILPRTATQDAYTRLAPFAPVNLVVAVPQPSPQSEIMPFMDPAHGPGRRRLHLRVLLHAAGRGLLCHQRSLGRP
jgi:hypothetical protein